MTPHEKAVEALNNRLERLQVNLRDARSDTARQFLFQSLVVTTGMGEAMTDYIKAVGVYAQRRHGDFKQTNATLGARHAELLQGGKEQLERFKADPTDRAIRKEIERAQQEMTAIQKKLRREAYDLQGELAVCVAIIDKLATSVRRLAEADAIEGLERAVKLLIEHVRELYAALEASLPSGKIVDAAAWETSASTELTHATDFQDAYARAGYQAMLALDVMTMAVSGEPPADAAAATERATATVSARLKDIAARFTAS